MSRWIELRADGQVAPKFARAFHWLMERAAAGDALAQANLGAAYLGSAWTKPDTEQHLYWLRQAAERLDPVAAERLADYHAAGLLVAPDPIQAFKLRLLAAEAGSATAQYAIARAFAQGEPVPVDPASAARWYARAAEQAHLPSLIALAELLRTGGPGLPPDYAESLRLSRRAAELGSAEAMADTAGMLLRGQGAPADRPAALALYEQAANQGYVYAMTMLGSLYAQRESAEPDYPRARQWLERAVAHGNAYAMRELGRFAEQGLGTEKHLATAFEWYDRAAREGDAWAQYKVGLMLREGRGAEIDLAEAANWFRLSAEQGEPAGQANLGYHYLKGLGVERDVTAAFTQLTAALRQEKDAWTATQLLELLFESSPAEKQLLRDPLRTLAQDHTLDTMAGPLPDLVVRGLRVVMEPAEAAALDRELAQRLAASNRRESTPDLAWRAYTGGGLPYNLALARAWAATAAEFPEGAAVLPIIDSLAAETPESREAARQQLYALADAGDLRAASALGYRFLVGEGETCDPDRAMHYLNAVLASRGLKAESVDDLYAQLRLPRPREPSAENLAAQLAKLPEPGPDSPPRPLHRSAAQYPMDLRVSGMEGSATVRFMVDPDGRVTKTTVLASTHPLFAAAAEAALQRWRFAPALKAGKRVSAEVVQEIRFALN